MASQAITRVYEAVARAAQRRDEIEMQGIDRVLSPLARKRVRPAMTAAAIDRIKRGGFRSILCPVDFSEQSRVALRYAAAIAQPFGGRLSILYVNDPLLIAAAGIALHDRSLAKRTPRRTAPVRRRDGVIRARGTGADRRPRREREAGRRDRKGRQASGVRPDRDGHERSDRRDEALHGLHDERRSAAHARARAGHPDATPRKRRRGPGRSWPGTRIIAAIGLDRHAVRDTQAAAAVAAWFESNLLLVHVVPEIKATAWLRRRIALADRTRIAHARSRLASSPAAWAASPASTPACSSARPLMSSPASPPPKARAWSSRRCGHPATCSTCGADRFPTPSCRRWPRRCSPFPVRRLAMRTLIVYATRQGHTRRIAEHIAAGLVARTRRGTARPEGASRANRLVAIRLGLPRRIVHAGHHEPEMIAFVKRHRQALEQRRAVFVSVTLSEAGAEDVRQPKPARERAAGDAQRMIDVFVQETGWTTSARAAGRRRARLQSVQLPHSFRDETNRAQGWGTDDTSRDYEFTDWAALDRFVADAARAAGSRAMLAST